MRQILSILILLLFVPTWSGEPRIPRFAQGARLIVRPLDFPAGLRDRRLTYLAGWELDSRDPAFGGFSALSVVGSRFLLLSDGGLTLAFDFSADGTASNVAFGALPDGPGAGWRKEDRDSESLTIDPRTGQAWVGFEPSDGVRGAIWRYDRGLTRAEAHAEPVAMRRWPVNGGAEAMVRLRSGRFIAISEIARLPRTRRLRSVAFAGDPAVAAQRSFRFTYQSPLPGSRATDAAQLPDGDLVIVNRSASFSKWFAGSIALVRTADIKPGADVRGRLAGRILPPLPQENYEAVAVTREGTDTILWIVSDDNESILQRTLLLKFRLEPAPGIARTR